MKIADLVDKLIPPPTPYLKRGTKGRFVSKKKTAELPPPTISHETVTVTFYGSSISKYRVDTLWYFSIADVLAVGKTPINLEKVQYSDQFEEVKKKNSIKVDNIEVADATGMMNIIKEVKAVFPGPLSRWLFDLAA